MSPELSMIASASVSPTQPMRPGWAGVAPEISRITPPTKVLTEAAALGLGMNLRGRAGMRFTEEDYERLVAAMRPAAPVERRRRRRSA